jgi:hypothetical protein
MFVVAMTIAVLGSIGAWAVQSAALEVRMAGYERQNTQTHYLAEYGILSASQDLGPGYAQQLVGLAVCGTGGTREACNNAQWSVADPNATTLSKSCHRWTNATQATTQFIPSGMTPLDSADGGGAPGSFGVSNTVGDFNVELTEVAQGPTVSGTSGGPTGMFFYYVTLTSDGKTQQALSGTNYAAFYGSEGDEQLRSRVVVGPMPQINLTGCPP